MWGMDVQHPYPTQQELDVVLGLLGVDGCK
jgi:hypothetical protein